MGPQVAQSHLSVIFSEANEEIHCKETDTLSQTHITWLSPRQAVTRPTDRFVTPILAKVELPIHVPQPIHVPRCEALRFRH